MGQKKSDRFSKSVLYTLQSQGIEGLLLQSLNRFGIESLNPLFIKYKWGFKEDVTIEDLELISIPPNEVKYYDAFPFQDTGMNAVLGTGMGSWDNYKKPLEDIPQYQAIHNRFNHGVSWGDTEYYNTSLDRIKKGDVAWKSSTVRALDAYCEEIDSLFEKINSEGYRSQYQLYQKGSSYNQTRVNDYFIPDELRVAVDRKGDFIRVSGGFHRLAIARISEEVERIPAILQIKHKEWNNERGITREPLTLDHPLVQLANNNM